MVIAVMWDFTRLWGVPAKKSLLPFQLYQFGEQAALLTAVPAFKLFILIQHFFLAKYLNAAVI